MTTPAILRQILTLVTLLLLGLPMARGQEIAGIELSRLGRLRPLPPFDRDGGYRLLDLLDEAPWAQRGDSTRASTFAQWSTKILLGQEVKLSDKWSLLLDGLIHIPAHRNKIDGWWMGYEVVGSYRPKAGHHLLLRTSNNLATRLRQWRSESNVLYFYAPERSGLAVLSFGITSRETTHLSYEEIFSPQWVAPIGANTPVYDFHKRYLSLRNNIDLIPGLRLTGLMVYEHRMPSHSHSWLGTPIYTHKALVAEANLQWDMARRHPATSPQHPTSTQRPMGYFAPMLGLSYRAAIDPHPRGRIPYSQYQLLELSLRASYAWSDQHRLSWGAVAGGYIDRKHVTIADERYLTIAEDMGRTPMSASWATLSPDRYLGKRWLWGYADTSLGRLTITRLASIGWEEALHLRGLWSERGQWYEAGYSIGWGELLRVGFFAGCNFRDEQQLRLRLSLPMLLLLGKASSRH